jgi:allantoate deiminase
MNEAGLGEATLLMERCDELAGISSDPEHLERVHLSPEHAATNAVVAGWMTEAGLVTWQDAAGNQCGRREGVADGLPALLLGSHIDTVPDAGRYDGMLGVLLAIAVAKRLHEAKVELPFALEVVAFSDEEGTRFGNALAGSRAFSRGLDAEWLGLTDKNGITFAEALKDFGLDPDRLPGAVRNARNYIGYLEAHIEQGPLLEDADRRLGVVTSIAGARRFHLTMTGRAGHAGGTPYDRRRDALVGASELVIEVERLSKRYGTIGTVGQLQAFPGGVNVIPGRVEFSLDLRAEHDDNRDAVLALIQSAGAEIARRRSLAFAVKEIYRADAVVCDPRLLQAIEDGIRSTGDGEPVHLWSRAGHDGMAVVDLTPIAMLFIRCRGGVSHSPEEHVKKADVAAALDAFEAAVLSLARSSLTVAAVAGHRAQLA